MEPGLQASSATIIAGARSSHRRERAKLGAGGECRRNPGRVNCAQTHLVHLGVGELVLVIVVEDDAVLCKGRHQAEERAGVAGPGAES